LGPGIPHAVPNTGSQITLPKDSRHWHQEDDEIRGLKTFPREIQETMTHNKTTVSNERVANSRWSLSESTPVFGQPGGATDEINISGNQVLVALAAGFCFMGPLLWAFVRYWLFAL
jgi:hypothetical protein